MAPVNPVRRPRRPGPGEPPPSLDKSLPPPPPPPPAADMTTVLVGAKQLSFKVDRRLLCDVSPFFRQRLQDPQHHRSVCLWLPGESATMFALFVEWVHAPASFRRFLDQALHSAHETSQQACQDMHWAIIRLHLFASHLGLDRLQDVAMDTLQDLYLKCDWDVPPSLIIYLYTQCEALQAVRIRRWAVAMVAFSLAGPSTSLKFHPQDAATSDRARFRDLLDSLPAFAADYAMHVNNVKAAGLDVRFKNPQLRISANRLRNDQRLFGFRECSFHSHRATVGQGRCPNADSRCRSKHASELEAAMDDLALLASTSAAPAADATDAADAAPPPLFSRDGDGGPRDKGPPPGKMRSIPDTPST